MPSAFGGRTRVAGGSGCGRPQWLGGADGVVSWGRARVHGGFQSAQPVDSIAVLRFSLERAVGPARAVTN